MRLLRHLTTTLSLGLALGLSACGAGGSSVPADTPPVEAAAVADATALDDSTALMDLEIQHFVREMAHVAKELGFELDTTDPVEDGIERDAAELVPDPNEMPGGDSRTDGLPTGAPPSGFGYGGIDRTGDADVTKTIDPESGEPTVTKTYETDLGQRTESTTYHRDGSTTLYTHEDYVGTTEIYERPNGSGYHRHTSADGDTAITTYYGPGQEYLRTLWRRGDRTAEGRMPPRWMNRNPGDEPSWWQKELADWAWRQHQLGRHTPGKPYPLGRDLVNPEDPEYSGAIPTGPSVWVYVGDLVMRPDPMDSGSSGAHPGEQAARIMRDVLLQLAQGVTPGGRPTGE